LVEKFAGEVAAGEYGADEVWRIGDAAVPAP
jgi:hypothetical protein